MEYPKALYKGSNVIYDHQIAENLEQEIDLRKNNYVDFVDLPEPVVESRVVGNNTLASGSKTHDGLVEKLAWTEEQLATSQGEFIAFKNDIEAMKARITELQGDICIGQNSQIGEDDQPALNPSGDYSLWTADQLRDELTKRNIKFKVRDSKDDLLALLERNNEPKDNA